METINLNILNVIENDKGFYLCIVANSLKSFRVTYAYLNVLNQTNLNTTLNNDLNNHQNYNINEISNNNIIKLNEKKLNSFIERNKATIAGISFVILLIILIIVLSICYCCFQYVRQNKYMSKNYKDKNLKQQQHQINVDNNTASKMNSLLEKTMKSMKKVTNFIFYFKK